MSVGEKERERQSPISHFEGSLDALSLEAFLPSYKDEVYVSHSWMGWGGGCKEKDRQGDA